MLGGLGRICGGTLGCQCSVQWTAASAQSRRGLLRSDVALRLGHHLVANQELPHCGATEKRRIEVDVKVTCFDLLIRAIEWCLV